MEKKELVYYPEKEVGSGTFSICYKIIRKQNNPYSVREEAVIKLSPLDMGYKKHSPSPNQTKEQYSHKEIELLKRYKDSRITWIKNEHSILQHLQDKRKSFEANNKKCQFVQLCHQNKCFEQSFISEQTYNQILGIKNKGNYQKNADCFAAYAILEFMPNGDLEHYFERRYKDGYLLQSDELLFLLQNILTAIETLHTKGISIMHRDLKPSNLLFDKNFNLIIHDFGSALQRKRQEGKSSQEQFYDKINVGTKRYKAPEILQVEKFNNQNQHYKTGYYSNKVDIYSAGKIIQKLLKEFSKANMLKADVEIMKQLEILLKLCCWEAQKNQCCKIGNNQENTTETNYNYSPKKRPLASHLLNLELLKQSNPDEYEQLKKLNFSWLSQQEQGPIRKKLFDKKNKHKVQIKRVLHMANQGYCFVLENQKIFIVLWPLRRKEQQLSLIEFNEDLRARLQKAYRKDRKDNCQDNFVKPQFKSYDQLFSTMVFPFMQDWRQADDIDKFVGDQSKIQEVNFLKDNIILLKLSNKVVQFIFADQQQESGNLIFTTYLSFNFSKMRPKEIMFVRMSKESELIESKIFQNAEKAMAEESYKEYVEYALKVAVAKTKEPQFTTEKNKMNKQQQQIILKAIDNAYIKIYEAYH